MSAESGPMSVLIASGPDFAAWIRASRASSGVVNVFCARVGAARHASPAASVISFFHISGILLSYRRRPPPPPALPPPPPPDLPPPPPLDLVPALAPPLLRELENPRSLAARVRSAEPDPPSPLCLPLPLSKLRLPTRS